MNRYQRELEEMDKRRRVRTRAWSIAASAAVAIIALWSAGVRPSEWFTAIEGHSAQPLEKPPVAESAASTTSAVLPLQSPAASREAPAAAVAGTDSSISPVARSLVLVATSPGRSVREGTATLGVVRANPQTYVAGATLVNGARLTEIHSDYVVLERQNRSVRLYVDSTKNPAANELLLVGGAQEVTPVVASSNEPLTDYLRPSPVFEGEKLRGYEVYPGQRAGVFAKIGLQGGDVITALNDAPLSDPAGALERFHQLLSGVAMVATVERKGESKTVMLDGSLIVAEQERLKQAPATPVAGLTEP